MFSHSTFCVFWGCIALSCPTCLCSMSSFKHLFEDVGKPSDLPADWIGTSYACRVKLVKGEGCQPEVCNAKVLSKRGSTTGLKNHIRDHHPTEYQTVLKSSPSMTTFFPSSKDAIQKEKIVLAFAANTLPYQVLDSETFKYGAFFFPPFSLLCTGQHSAATFHQIFTDKTCPKPPFR